MTAELSYAVDARGVGVLTMNRPAAPTRSAGTCSRRFELRSRSAPKTPTSVRWC